ncbi:hypothetical protein [Burkholderia pseudomultivorans]|uniref:hypothetical protein n=1 Tax=Burkholderia pseudomultivorans TaxID=1207504 RepID=UPI0015840B6E|nr:hypothetical protein [Burkholderia pseudomultivorans]
MRKCGTAACGTPRAAGWIIGRFVGSGHFNISPKAALEVAWAACARRNRLPGGPMAAIAARVADAQRALPVRRLSLNRLTERRARTHCNGAEPVAKEEAGTP